MKKKVLLIVSIGLFSLAVILIGVLGAVMFRSNIGIFAIIMLAIITLVSVAGVVVYGIYRGVNNN